MKKDGLKMKLSLLLSALTEYQTKAMKDIVSLDEVEISGICFDSREIKKGDLFVCLAGEKHNGHDFVLQAEKLGAVGVVCDKELDCKILQIIVSDTRSALALLSAEFYMNPSKRLTVIGVTGTNGKTTTANMLAEILRAAGKRVGVIGTLGVVYGRKTFATGLTTPDPVILQKTLYEMAEAKIEYVVMEVSAHALYYKKTVGVKFAGCIFTNFTQDHLDFFKDMKKYKKAKMKLLKPEISPFAVVNADDSLARDIFCLRQSSDLKKRTKTVFYGLKNPADCFAVLTSESLKDVNFLLNINDDLANISLKLIGIHNVYNALAAATCAKELGVSTDDIERGLNSLKKVNGRLERIGEYNGGQIFVDFAHTPDGLEKSLRALKKYCKGRLVCVFGCGGNRDKEKRPVMGAVASTWADFCYLTSDNPRDEEPSRIIADIESGIENKYFDYFVVTDRTRAVTLALKGLKNGDVLLVAGKGGEEYQEIKGIKCPYKDEDLIKSLLEKD